VSFYPFNRAIAIPWWRGIFYRIFGRKLVTRDGKVTLVAYQFRSTVYIHKSYLLALNEAAPELFALVDKVAELEHEIHGLEEQVLDLGTDLDRLNSENDELMETMGEIQTLCAEYPGLIPTDIYQIATSALKEKA